MSIILKRGYKFLERALRVTLRVLLCMPRYMYAYDGQFAYRIA